MTCSKTAALKRGKTASTSKPDCGAASPRRQRTPTLPHCLQLSKKTYPASNEGRRATVRTEMQSRLDFSPVLGGIVAAVFGLMLVILIIASANVMNLMPGRGRSRAREIAIRLSLGSGRVRLVRQLMAE